MVTIKQKFSHDTQSVDTWLAHINQAHPHLKNIDLIRQATQLAQVSSEGLTTFYGQPCLEQSLEMAEILLEMKLDSIAIAAAMIVSTVEHTSLSVDTLKKELNEDVAKLVQGVLQMNVLDNLQESRDKTQIDRIRKIFLSMVSDIRVVLIKLAERTCIMRGIKNINFTERKRIAQETMDIYAPLANRLGIGQLKWELEDGAFHYINPDIYKSIATFLAERRIDREQRIDDTINKLQIHLKQANIKATINGRAKHIYSIYLKTLRKNLHYKEIYDCSAIRILVPTIEDCYAALSVVHQLFEHIPDEFDDYINHPKPNGYRSIHTAVVGFDKKNLEIQIRTHEMHEESEHGFAAHWVYKENKISQSGYEAKITFLRQLLAWHKDMTEHDVAHEKMLTEVLEDTIYVFTPDNEIIDLPIGATPLDFAYHIHSELGNRCRGAKINGNIVPLTYTLQTGDQVEIISIPNGTPSRDWINKEFGYLKTSRARAKVARWFKQQDVAQYIEIGKENLERELARAGIRHTSFEKIAARFNYKNDDALFAAIGHGSIRIAQVINVLQTDHLQVETKATLPLSLKKEINAPHGMQIAGVNDLLMRIARCCKPIPTDKIIGYITHGRGVSIHRADCNNIALKQQPERTIQVTWDNQKSGDYYVDLQIRAHGQHDILKEVTSYLVNAKINLISLNSTISKKNNMIYIVMTIQISNANQLEQAINQISQLPHVIDVIRKSTS